MNFRWIRKISSTKLLRLFFEMALYQYNLFFIRRVFDDYFLQAAIVKFLKHMGRLFEIERHHLRATRRDLSLASLSRQNCRRKENRHARNYQRAASDKYMCLFGTTLVDFHENTTLSATCFLIAQNGP